MDGRTGTAGTATVRRVTLTPGARRVLAAAERLFYDRGIHAVGVDTIAAEAGVTKKTLYDRFGSKDQLVVEYLAGRDDRWRAFLIGRIDTAPPEPAARIVAIFEASRDWTLANSAKGCSFVNAHAEIGPEHPAHTVITEEKRWILALCTRLAGEHFPGHGERLGRELMLLHEGSLVAYGLTIFPDALDLATDRARALLQTGNA
ncbi:MAG: TetR family transcriptional regulator [Streptosporangiales bacterium]|nr:TetR family transcriptional regulator [Streptosporangiales bacterium]